VPEADHGPELDGYIILKSKQIGSTLITHTPERTEFKDIGAEKGKNQEVTIDAVTIKN
jgi:hypothetical protein